MKLGSLSRTLPQVPNEELLAMPGVYGVKKIETHEDFDLLQGHTHRSDQDLNDLKTTLQTHSL